MEYCPHCMRRAEGRFCNFCGGALDWKASSGQLPVSTLLRGSDEHTYQIGAARGQGGFGITYAAMDLVNGQRVAIKEYFPTRCAVRNQLNRIAPMTGQEAVYRSGMESFLEEAMMLSAVGALPSVVTVKDYFEANGTAYLVMEYVDGVPLHEIVTKQGKMRAGELLPKLQELLMDLDTLHRAGIIHRDISPDNLILMPNGKLKLLDFGSARSVQDGKSMTVLLKAGFSPIEQYQSRGQGPWSDVYALAGTVYYCLTGTIPPASVDRLEVDEIRGLREQGVELTEQQEEALMWGLVLQPKARPQSMEVFRQKLFGVANTGAYRPIQQPVQQPPQPQPAPAGQPAVQQTPQPQPVPAGPQVAVQQPQPAAAVTPGKKKNRALMWIMIAAAAMITLVTVGVVGIYASTHGTTSDGYAYILKSGSYATITGYKGDGGEIEIPTEIKGLPVRYIEDRAFEDCDEITRVILSSRVDIPVRTFDSCNQITSVIINGTENIPSGWGRALSNCPNLRCVFFSQKEVYDQCMSSGTLSKLEDAVVCYFGQDTGWGQIRSVETSGGIVYAFTNQLTAVVMRLPSHIDGDTLAPSLSGYTVILPDGRIPGQPRFITGTTSDGFQYSMPEDKSSCTITGYTGSANYVVIPDEINGISVTSIGEKAFAGMQGIESVSFPVRLQEIRAGAFENCGNLRDIYVNSRCTAAATAFTNCGMLRCCVLGNYDLSLSGWTLPSDFCVLYYGMNVEIGYLDYVGVDNQGVIYGITTDNRALVMDIPEDASEITILDTAYGMTIEWIYSGALNDVSGSTLVWLPGNALIPYELLSAASWRFLRSNGEFTLSECWWYTCQMCAMVNEERGYYAAEPNLDIVKAAMQAAMELSQDYNASYRPNGSGWFSVLGEYGVSYDYGSGWKGYYESTSEFDQNIYSDLLEYASDYAQPEEDYYYNYYDYVGAGLYYDASTGRIYKISYGIIVD